MHRFLILAYWLYIYIYRYMANQKKKKVLEFVKQALAGWLQKQKIPAICKQASKANQTSARADEHALEKLLLLLLVDSWCFFFRFCVVEENLCEARQAPVLCTSSIAFLSNLKQFSIWSSNPALHLILPASSLAEKRREKLLY